MRGRLPYLIVGVFFVWYLVFSGVRHLRLESFLFDLGYYEQIVWLAAHGKPLFSTLIEANFFTDHISPSLFLILPIYYLWPSPLALLTTQALVVAIGALPLYWLSYKETGSKLFSLSLMLAYLGFWGIHNAIAYDFHPLTLGAGMLVWMVYFYETKRWKWFWLATMMFGGLQENNWVLLGVLGFIVAVKHRDRMRGGVMIAVSLTAFIGATFLFPRLFGGNYNYFPTDWSLKITSETGKVVFFPLASFAFLPLVSPSYLLLFAEELFGRVVVARSQTWGTLGYQYNAIEAAIMALATIETVARFKKESFRKLAGIVILIGSVIMFVVVRPETTRVFTPSFYDFSFIKNSKEVLRLIPDGVSVAATNNLGAQLAGRKEIVFLTNCLENTNPWGADGRRCFLIQPDYVVANLSEDQQWNNFYPDYDLGSIKRLVDNYLAGEYELVGQDHELMVLRRRALW